MTDLPDVVWYERRSDGVKWALVGERGHVVDLVREGELFANIVTFPSFVLDEMEKVDV